MKRTRLFSAGILGSLFLVMIWSHRGEPSYQDKPLSYWFKEWLTQRDSFAPPPEVFRKLGEQAVPYLVAGLKKRESRPNRFHHYVYDLAPEKLQLCLARPVRANVIRWKAARALLELGPGAKAALPDLIQALYDPDSRVRYAALNAIVAVGPEAQKATPDLIRALEIQDRWFRYALAEAIVKLDFYPEQAAPKIAQALIDIIKSLESASGRALATLQRIKPLNDKIFLALVHGIQDQDKYLLRRAKLHQPTTVAIRSNTFVALVEFGHTNESAIRLMSQRLEHPDGIARAAAAEFMSALVSPPPTVRAPLTSLWQETNGLVCINAAFALYRMDSSLIQPTLETLVNGLADGNIEIQRRAARFLAGIGSSAVAPVAGLLGRKDSATRAAATQALVKFAPEISGKVLSFSFDGPML